MLHDKATISQSLAGALICAGGGKEGRLAAAPASGGAGRRDPAPHSRAWTGRLALSSSAPGPSRDPAPGGRGLPAEVGARPPASSDWPWAERPVLAGNAPGKRASLRPGPSGRPGRLPGTGRRQNLHRVAWGQGPTYLSVDKFVVILTRGPGRSFSERRAPPDLSPAGRSRSWGASALLGPKSQGPLTLLRGRQ